MRTPCELTVSEYLPMIRIRLVNELSDQGKNQSEISEILGISQPRVSQYLNQKQKKIKELSTRGYRQLIDIVEKVSTELLTELAQNVPAPKTIPIICAGCRQLRSGNALCELHMLTYPKLNDVLEPNKNCDLCLKWKTSPPESRFSLKVLELRRQVLQNIESIGGQLLTKLTFLDYIPQIGAQLCIFFSESKEEHLRNIAGYPGRIIRYQNQAKIVSKPEFNVSKTTGTLLLDIRKILPKITAVLSIKNKNVNYLNMKDFHVFKTQEGDIKGYMDQIRFKIHPNTNKITKLAILDDGSIGYEPIAYFFVENPFFLLQLFD